MANSVLSAPQFQDEKAAFAFVEASLWPDGPTCPHCGNADAKRIGRLNGKTTRPGLHKCYECKKPFTVRKGTIFEESRLPLHLWLQVIHLFCASKKGISTRQIQRMLQCSMKTAWFLGHRIRLAMAPGSATPLGGLGKTVEADETELARSRKTDRPANFRRSTHNPKVLSLVERGGNIRSVTLDHKGVDKHHLDRYLAEFDFRQNTRVALGINDTQRAAMALQGVKGKRLTYGTATEATAD
jgi:transposase-like protein